MTQRPSNRKNGQLRDVKITPNVNPHAEGSCMIECGNTRVLCTASIQYDVPRWLKGKGKGWVTAEYGMLPRSTHDRIDREAVKGKQTGRTTEIQRLIGRSLRAVVDLKALGNHTIWLDCDVIVADGGTRTAAITGAFVALQLAVNDLVRRDRVKPTVIIDHIAAISSGITTAGAVLDLDYAEDSKAIADGNFVLTGSGQLVEVQITAEERPITEAEYNALIALAKEGISNLISVQKQSLNKQAA